MKKYLSVVIAFIVTGCSQFTAPPPQLPGEKVWAMKIHDDGKIEFNRALWSTMVPDEFTKKIIESIEATGVCEELKAKQAAKKKGK